MWVSICVLFLGVGTGGEQSGGGDKAVASHMFSVSERPFSPGHPINTTWIGYKAASILSPNYFLRKFTPG